MEIRLLNKNDAILMSLLLVADPSQEKVMHYVRQGLCYLAEKDKRTIGVYVLLHIEETVIELVNLSVLESYQGQGIGKCLINHAILQAKKHHYQTVQVGTGNSSISQLAL